MAKGLNQDSRETVYKWVDKGYSGESIRKFIDEHVRSSDWDYSKNKALVAYMNERGYTDTARCLSRWID